MSSAYNPYAPPQAEIDPGLSKDSEPCRDGNLVRLGTGGTLPDRCIRCGRPAQGCRIERALYWRPTWLHAAIWGGLPVLFILGILEPVMFLAFCLGVFGFGVVDMFLLAIVASLLYRTQIRSDRSTKPSPSLARRV